MGHHVLLLSASRKSEPPAASGDAQRRLPVAAGIATALHAVVAQGVAADGIPGDVEPRWENYGAICTIPQSPFL